MTNQLKTLGLSLLICAALSACGGSGGETSDNVTGDSASILSAQPKDTTGTPVEQADDSKVVTGLVESLRGDIGLAKDAQTKAEAKQVKDLAKKIETEMTTMLNQMSALAQTKNWSTPTVESSADITMRTALSKRPAADYSKEWLSTMKGRLQTNITRLQTANPADADLKAEGDKATGVLQGLLADVEKTESTLK